MSEQTKDGQVMIRVEHFEEANVDEKAFYGAEADGIKAIYEKKITLGEVV